MKQVFRRYKKFHGILNQNFFAIPVLFGIWNIYIFNGHVDMFESITSRNLWPQVANKFIYKNIFSENIKKRLLWLFSLDAQVKKSRFNIYKFFDKTTRITTFFDNWFAWSFKFLKGISERLLNKNGRICLYLLSHKKYGKTFFGKEIASIWIQTTPF